MADVTVEPTAPDDDAGQGRGEAAAEAAAEIRQPKARKRRPVADGPARGRKIGLPDDVHDRLWQLARQKRSTVSAVATEILDRNLPRYRVEREG